MADSVIGFDGYNSGLKETEDCFLQAFANWTTEKEDEKAYEEKFLNEYLFILPIEVISKIFSLVHQQRMSRNVPFGLSEAPQLLRRVFRAFSR